MPNLREMFAETLLCMILVLFAGCSLTGGWIESSKSPDNPGNLMLLRPGGIEKGTYLVVSRRHSVKLAGEYLGVQTESTSQLVLRCDADTVHVPLGDIASIEVECTEYARLIGLGIGTTVDIGVLAATSAGVHRMSPGRRE